MVFFIINKDNYSAAKVEKNYIYSFFSNTFWGLCFGVRTYCFFFNFLILQILPPATIAQFLLFVR